MKHHWFVNVKSKIKTLNVPSNKARRKVELPSLRTIIELRSQSELELKVQSQLSVKRKLQNDDPDHGTRLVKIEASA